VPRDDQRARVYAAEQFVRTLFDRVHEHGNGTVEFFGANITLPPEARFASEDSGGLQAADLARFIIATSMSLLLGLVPGVEDPATVRRYLNVFLPAGRRPQSVSGATGLPKRRGAVMPRSLHATGDPGRGRLGHRLPRPRSLQSYPRQDHPQ